MTEQRFDKDSPDTGISPSAKALLKQLKRDNDNIYSPEALEAH
jgi:hypothetical protein